MSFDGYWRINLRNIKEESANKCMSLLTSAMSVSKLQLTRLVITKNPRGVKRAWACFVLLKGGSMTKKPMKLLALLLSVSLSMGMFSFPVLSQGVSSRAFSAVYLCLRQIQRQDPLSLNNQLEPSCI
jgi:hypothetical protein